MLNPNASVTSYYVYLSSKGELLCTRNSTGTLFETISPMIQGLKGENFALIIDNIKVNHNNELVIYPKIVLSNCK